MSFFRLVNASTLITFIVFSLILVGFQICFLILFIIMQFAVEFPKDIGNSFS